MRDISGVVQAITKWNNVYRSPDANLQSKLEALWEMGDYLHKIGARNPHSLGWKIQEATKGLIKRPTVFRSHKLRSIWSTKGEFVRDCRGIKGFSNLREMIPLLDPAQKVHRRIPTQVLAELKKKMRTLSPIEFEKELAAVKAMFKTGRLGERLDRAKHLGGYEELRRCFVCVFQALEKVMAKADSKQRDEVRARVQGQELLAVSNMALALTSKENARFYKRFGPERSSSTWVEFRHLYGTLRILLEEKSEIERARLRRLISPVQLALFFDMTHSLLTEEGVAEFLERRALEFPLGS